MSKPRNSRREVIGFTSIGAISFAVDFVSFNLLILIQWPVVLANLTAISLSALTGYLGNSYYSFRHKTKSKSVLRIGIRYLIYTVVSVIGSFFITSIVLWILTDAGIVMQNIGRTAVVLLVVGIRFWGLRNFVYK
jgi:putative flippase GtrA